VQPEADEQNQPGSEANHQGGDDKHSGSQFWLRHWHDWSLLDLSPSAARRAAAVELMRFTRLPALLDAPLLR
jgi:hypothetical protein